MYREFFAGLESIELPLVAMAFFVLIFAVVVVRTFVIKRRRDYDEMAALPLSDPESSDRNEVTP